jgi:hypothetical protein
MPVVVFPLTPASSGHILKYPTERTYPGLSNQDIHAMIADSAAGQSP